MVNRPTSTSRSGQIAKNGFTRVELFLVTAIVGLLAIVAYPAIFSRITPKANLSLSKARIIDMAMFQYVLDPKNTSQTFLAGDDGTSTQAFLKLLKGNYLSSASVLYLPAKGKTVYTGDSSYASLSGTNVCWDIFVDSAAKNSLPVGMPLDDSGADDVPLIFSTGNSVTMKPHGATVVTMMPETNPFGTYGMVVGYKSQSVTFLKSTLFTEANHNPTYKVTLLPASYRGKVYQQEKP